MLYRLLRLATLLWAAFLVPPTQAFEAAAIDAAIEAEMRERQVPGVALALVHKGQLRYAKGYGFANLEHGLPVTPDTVFAIASVSKPLLTLGLARLVEQGKLSWEDPLSKHLPDAPPHWRAITLAQLANHTAGIVRESPAFDENARKPDIDLIRATYAVPLDFPTGSKMQYCNICYFTLAEVMARTAGSPWPEVMAREVFALAGMADTRTTSVTDLVPRRAASYAWREGRQHNVREYVALRPSGAFLSTVRDLARLEAALHEGRVLGREALKRLETPTRLNDGSPGRMGNNPSTLGYGLGWDITELDGQPRLAHGGTLAGFRTHYARYPESGWAVILLANGDQARMRPLEERIARLLPR